MYAFNRLKPLGNFEENAPVDYWEEVITEDAHIQYYNHTTGEYHTSLPTAEESQRKSLVEEALPTEGTPQEMGPWNGVEGKLLVPWSGGESRGTEASPIAIERMGELPEPVVDCEGYERETQVLPPRDRV